MKLFSLIFIFSATLVIVFSLPTLADEKKKSKFLEDGKNEKWIQLFNGKDLTGWTPKIRYEKLGEDKRNTFLVADGVIKVNYKKYDEFNIFIGKIRYMDYNTEVIPVGQLLLPLITKRKSFEHEIELRALIWTLQHGKNKIVDNKFASTLGLSVPVDLDVLIEKIYVSPEAPDWLLILIQAMVDRFQLDKPVKQSDLASDPLY